MKHIKEVVFFQDYGLWAKCQKEARISGMHMASFIAESVEKYLVKQNEQEKIAINYTEELYDICEREAVKLKTDIAAFLEQCCKDVLEPEKPKPPWYVLPKA